MWPRALLLITALMFATEYGLCQQTLVTRTGAAPASPDDLLRQQVQQQLHNDTALSAVQAEVTAGQVMLTGTVASPADRSRALELARGVSGVRSVEEHIEAAADKQSSEQNKAAVTGQTAIDETSNNTAGSTAGNAGMAGTSPATGATSTPGGAALPGTAANLPPLPGGEDNQLLRRQVEQALESDPALAASRITVNVTDSQIELSGTVPTSGDKYNARRIAQSYGNNRQVVDNNLSTQSRTANPSAAGTSH